MAAANGGAPLAAESRLRNRFLRQPPEPPPPEPSPPEPSPRAPLSRAPFGPRHQKRTARRFSRSIDIKMPRINRIVICAEPPLLISGSGTPTTGASPITIAMLMPK